MKIEFTAEELQTLPESVQEIAADNLFDGEPDSFLAAWGESHDAVANLKTAHEEVTEGRKEARDKLSKIREALSIGPKDDALKAIEQLNVNREAGETLKVVNKELAQERATRLISEKILEHGGNMKLLLPHVKERLTIGDDGVITVKAENGAPALREDGEMQTVDDVVQAMRNNVAEFGALFAGTRHSGTGSNTGISTGTGPGLPPDPGDAPPTTMRRSEMTTPQKIAAVKEYGDLEGYPL
jgi:hypothetical protein